MNNPKILTFYNEASLLINGQIPSPRTAIIYPVYGCNLKCMGCLCSSTNKEKHFMDIKDFEKMIDNLKDNGVKAVEFCGGGEPLMHPQIERMIKYITQDKNMAFGIMTNGTLLNDELSKLIIKEAEYIRISVYDNTFKTAYNKLERLIELKKEYNSKTIVSGKFLLSKRNKDKIKEQCIELSKLELEMISVKAERNSEDEIDDEEAISVQNELNSINRGIIKADLKKSYIKERCWMAPIHALIDPFGNIYICCYYMNREDSHKIGNLFEKPFEEIWGSDIHKEKLNNIKISECNVYDCRWHGYNEQMRKLLEGNKLDYLFC
jgi:radical SAM protein with 4Fe4S-binding SPASM domain